MSEYHLDILAVAILSQGDDKDLTDIYEALEPYLTLAQFVDLGTKMELCPIHYCDAQICRDDESSCQTRLRPI